MSRTNLTKTLRNVTWISNVGNKFETECFIGCGTMINAFNFEVGHIQAVAEGGSNEPDNLKPICGTCNKVSGTMNMIEFIQKSGFSPTWLKTASFNCRYNTGPIVLMDVLEQIPCKYQIPRIEMIGKQSIITGWYYRVDADIGLPEHINVNDKTLVNGIPIADIDITAIPKIPLSMAIIKKSVKSEREIMKILKSIDFNLPNASFYKMINRIILMFKDYSDDYELIIQDQELYDEEKTKWIKSNRVEKFEDHIKSFLLANRVNCRF